MKLLLDTHALLWYLLGNDKLSDRARRAIDLDGNEVLVSAVSAMEIAPNTASASSRRRARSLGT